MKVLSIDFGLKNIGLAVSSGKLVEPFGQIKVSNFSQAVDKLVVLCQKTQIGLIVIGLPEGRLVKTIKKFAVQLKKAVNLPVVFQDETLTSKEAVKKMIEANKPLKKRQNQEHAFSACLILQDYLENIA